VIAAHGFPTARSGSELVSAGSSDAARAVVEYLEQKA